MRLYHLPSTRWLLVLALAAPACQSTKKPAPVAVTPPVVVVPPPAPAPADTAAPAFAPVPDFVPLPAPDQPTATRYSDLVHTKLDVRFDYAKQYLYGIAALTLRPHFYPQSTLRLDAKNFLIDKITIVGAKGAEKPLPYEYEDLENLFITLDRTYKAAETYTVKIYYTARPNERKTGGSEAITSDKGLYFINPDGKDTNKPRQIWTQGETQSNSAWFPTIDRPNQKTTQEISMTVESKYKTLSNGLLVSSKKNPDGTRTDTWRQDKPHAPYLVMLAVGDWAVVHDTWRKKVAVDYYVEPKYAGTAKAVFGRTPEMMEFFSQRLGVDYAWDKYAQVCVRDYVSGAMENTSATVHGVGLQMDRRELPDRDWDDYISHELFHHWFGDLVTAESWSNLPLNESFANYSELLWAEHRQGADAADYIQQRELNQYLAEAENKQVPLIRYRYQAREDMFDSHSYAKGGRVLHMLRTTVGDDAFFAALKLYLTKNRFKAAEISDLRLAFEEVTGEDLHWFFDQWVLRPGHADLAVRHEYNNDTLTVLVDQRQDSLFSPTYRMPVTIGVWIKGQKEEYPVTMYHAAETFKIPLSASPDLVTFDDQAVVLGTIDHTKSDAEWRYQYYHGGRYRHRYDAVKHCAQAMAGENVDAADRAVLLAALRDPFWSIRAATVEVFEKYNGEELDRVRAEVRRLAETDPNTQVQANAMATLVTLGEEPAAAEVLRRVLSDTASSYRLVGAAISGLTTLKQDDNLEASLKGLENTDNPDINGALGEYYAAHPSPARLMWFTKQLDSSSGVALYSLTQQFGEFLQHLPATERAPGIAKLDALARTHSAFYVRLGAYQALYGLAEGNEDVQDMLEAIRAQEKDERVKRFYEMMK